MERVETIDMYVSAVDFRLACGSRPLGWGGCKPRVNTSLSTIKRADLEISEGNLSFYIFGYVFPGIFYSSNPDGKVDYRWVDWDCSLLRTKVHRVKTTVFLWTNIIHSLAIVTYTRYNLPDFHRRSDFSLDICQWTYSSLSELDNTLSITSTGLNKYETLKGTLPMMLSDQRWRTAVFVVSLYADPSRWHVI